jgi:nucleoside-diphosphate-sugar epimerase
MDCIPCGVTDVDAFISNPHSTTVEAVKDIDGDVNILGAAGKMGLHLALTLQEAFRQAGKNNQIYAVSRFRTLRPRRDFEEHGFETICCDLSDREGVAGLPDSPNIFFMAGVKFGTAAMPDVLHRMNVEVPSLVAEHFRRSRVVVFSTGCVYPFTDVSSGGSREEDEVAPVGNYALSCRGREEAFFAGSRDHGLRCTIVRLNYAVELRYGVLVDIAQKVLNDEPIDVTTGHFNAIWQGDAINHVIQSLNSASSPPFIINVAGPDTITVRWVVERFGEKFGKEPTLTGQEASTTWLNNAEKARNLFGPTTIGIEEIIGWTAEWLKEGGETWGKPTLFERRSGDF